MKIMGSRSDTEAVDQVFQDHEVKLGEYVKQLACVKGQVGAIFSVKNRLAGLEYFDCTDTCSLLMPKLIRSYALDAIDPGYHPADNPGIGSPAEVIELVTAAGYSTHKAVGEGDDLRFDSTPDIAGGALFARDRIVHLCVFVSAEGQRVGDGDGYRTSASLRRRFWNVA
jgi:hypothetical protein